MKFDSIFPCFVVMAIAVGAGAMVLKISPFFRRVIDESAKSHLKAVDGFRGFLAFGVFFCHAVGYRRYFEVYRWEVPASHFYSMIGQVSVLFFFMITGFLFWSKAIRSGGRIPAIALYRNRFWRLYPLYAVVVLVSLAIGLVVINLHPPANYAHSKWELLSLFVPGLISWFSVGPFQFGYLLTPTWSLWFECLFCLALPVLGFLAVSWRAVGLFGIIAVAYVVAAFHSWLPHDRYFWLGFVAGMASAHVVRLWPMEKVFRRKISAVLPIVLIVLLFTTLPDVYDLSSVVGMAIIFHCVVSGCDFFGLLNLPAAQMLGAVSYSIYLVHMLLYYVVLHSIDTFHAVSRFSDLSYWGFITGLAVLTVVVSAIAFRWLEFPFMHVRTKLPPAA